MLKNLENLMVFGVLILFVCCVSKSDKDILMENSLFQSQEQFIGENAIEAKEFMSEFLQNEPSALKKYTGTRIKIIGEISNKATPKDNPPEKDFNYITFGNGDTDGIYIMCYFNEYVYWTVAVGEKIIIEGNFREIESIGNVYKEITLGECKIIKEME
jgi:ppGpp synthetase/RelA/SpoT-type nucleotidyltranferase